MSRVCENKENVVGAASGAALVLGLLLSTTAWAQDTVSFRSQVLPVLRANCVECHRPNGQGFDASGLNLESYEGIMRGTRFGPVVIPGDIHTSNLLRIVSGQVSSEIRMPYHRMQLPVAETQTIMRWIQQGAPDN